jgi:hypothetical protein
MVVRFFSAASVLLWLLLDRVDLREGRLVSARESSSA